MKYIADLHIHSHYSRATAKSLIPENLSLWAQKKGIAIIGTGDFTHPGWLKELEEKLVPAEDGLFKLRPELQKAVNSQVPPACRRDTRFLLSGEISCIYKKDGKTRKVHHLILMPNMDAVCRFNGRLDRIGNITSDGRPILGLDSRDLLEICLDSCEKAFFIPAHIWTPWFSVFGSKSGFDTLEECFEDLTPYIHALETGLSSDPPMNRTLSALDDYLLVSNSDAHSPNKLGREANLLDTEMNYPALIQAMTDGEGFLGTIEFFPEEGKYHLDGHRKCHVRMEPVETQAHGGRCPKCGKPLTVGVLNRVFELADRDEPKLSKAFFNLVPLPEVLAQLLGCGPATKKVSRIYEKLIAALGPELPFLMDKPLTDIEPVGGVLLKEAIAHIRSGNVIRLGGYDGEYGRIKLFDDTEKAILSGQLTLFEQPTRKTSRPAVKRPARPKTDRGTKKEASPCRASWDDPILDPLNDAQRAAVLHPPGDLIIVAGPGTGKTLTLTHRIGYLVREGIAEPKQILALTFTRKAAGEMRQRLDALLPHDQIAPVTASTFHGFCLDVLRRFGDRTDFILCSETDVDYLARQCLEGHKGDVPAFLKALPKIKAAKVLGTGENDFDPALLAHYETFQNQLQALGMMDFDDLELETFGLFQGYPEITTRVAARFPWVFVDEYQDTNPVQAAILKKMLCAGLGTLCVIGDPDQAIYGFRGADVKNFLDFSHAFPDAHTIALEKNYRSAAPILRAAATVMEKEKPLIATASDGSPLRFASCRTEGEEAEMIVEQVERLMGGTTYFSMDSGRVASHETDHRLSLGDVAVLYRLNAQGDALEKALYRAGLPFIRSGETPLIHRYPVNIIYRCAQCLAHPENRFYADIYRSLIREAGVREMDIPAVAGMAGPLLFLIDEVIKAHDFDLSSDAAMAAVAGLQRLTGDFKGDLPAFLDFLSLERGIDHDGLMGDRLALMSLHAAKGLEWPVVFITGCENRLMPCVLFGDRDDDEERRLFYVGMTRAQKKLILSYVNKRTLKGRMLEMQPSPFLEAIPKDIFLPLERGEWRPRKKQEQLSLF